MGKIDDHHIVNKQTLYIHRVMKMFLHTRQNRSYRNHFKMNKYQVTYRIEGV